MNKPLIATFLVISSLGFLLGTLGKEEEDLQNCELLQDIETTLLNKFTNNGEPELNERLRDFLEADTPSATLLLVYSPFIKENQTNFKDTSTLKKFRENLYEYCNTTNGFEANKIHLNYGFNKTQRPFFNNLITLAKSYFEYVCDNQTQPQILEFVANEPNMTCVRNSGFVEACFDKELQTVEGLFNQTKYPIENLRNGTECVKNIIKQCMIYTPPTTTTTTTLNPDSSVSDVSNVSGSNYTASSTKLRATTLTSVTTTSSANQAVCNSFLIPLIYSLLLRYL